MTKHKVAQESELEDGSRIITEVEGLEIAVFKLEGEYYALTNYCPHQAGPLCEGRMVGAINGESGWKLDYDEREDIISCPWHGWRFNIKTGESEQTDDYRIPMFDIEVDSGEIYVER